MKGRQTATYGGLAVNRLISISWWRAFIIGQFLGMVSGFPMYNLYYGNLHSHTSYSDGRGTPRQAFAYARDTARIHILAVTDHGEMLSSAEWEDIKKQADSATKPGQFLGLAGFEWTSRDGHINIFNTSDYTSAHQNPTVGSIYEWLANRNNAIGQFNHPGGPYLFNNFRHSSIGDISMTLFEIQNRHQAEVYYVALDSGWRVGISANQDNHFPDWGKGHQLTGIWAESLTKSSIISAIQNRRTFGTLDRDFQLWFKANDQWMGSTIPNGEVQFEVFAFDPSLADFIRRIDIITNNNVVLDSLILGNTNYARWQTRTYTNSTARKYFFVRVIENDSDYILSSPIWTKGGGILEDGEYKIFPNPFISSITFNFNSIHQRSLDEIKIYSVSGKEIKSFLPKLPVRWAGEDKAGKKVPAGVYFVVFRIGNSQWCEKIIRLNKPIVK